MTVIKQDDLIASVADAAVFCSRCQALCMAWMKSTGW